jgi:metal-responsive CopG/Arc/MetJ family transcriptional regulator
MDNQVGSNINRVRVNFYFTKDMYSGVEAISVADGRSMSDVIREAVRDYLEERLPKMRGNDGNQSQS